MQHKEIEKKHKKGLFLSIECLYTGFYTELRKSSSVAKRTAQADSICKAYSIDADEDDGCPCSSVEVAVMAMERRTTDT